VTTYLFNHKIKARTIISCAIIALFLSGCIIKESPPQGGIMNVSRQIAQDIPYQIDGVTYYPLKNARDFSEEGVASWYGPSFHGQLTSNKEVYNMNEMTAAHKTLPFNTLVKVINQENGAETIVRINDRGPFSKERVIDLSYQAAKKLGVIGKGTANVRLIALNNGNDELGTNMGVPETYAVQVAVFKNSSNASRIGQKLENSRIKTFYQGGTEYFRVVVGSFTDFEDALKVRDEVRKQGFSKAYIVPDN
jgi:rare lipoprotein A